MAKVNWKAVGMGMAILTAALSVVSTAVDGNQRKDEIREEVEKQLAEREEKEES